MRFFRLVMVNRRTGEIREYFTKWLPREERLEAGRRYVANDPAEGNPADFVVHSVLPPGVPR